MVPSFPLSSVFSFPGIGNDEEQSRADSSQAPVSPNQGNTVVQPEETVVTAMRWLPRSGEVFPNPWFDASNFSSIRARSSLRAVQFRLASLPPELIYYIAKLLPKESAIALALTSHAFFDCVGRQCFKGLSITEHWNLILLLERDSDLMVACQQCMKLHNPFVGSRNVPKSYRPRHLPCMEKDSSLLPLGLTSALCRLLAKQYIIQEPYGELLAMVGRTRTYTLPDFKLFFTTTARIVKGNLLVRSEALIAPLTTKGDLTSRGAYLLDVVTNGYKGLQVCPHVQWHQLGVELSHDRSHRADGSWYASHIMFSTDDRYALAHKARDANSAFSACSVSEQYGHSSTCYDSTPVIQGVLVAALGPGLKCALLHPQPCQASGCANLPPQHKLNLVRGCEVCETDFCIGAQNVKGVGRVIALTTWKNLGGVGPNQWALWYPHYTDFAMFATFYNHLNQQDESVRVKMTRDLSKGMAAHVAFEKYDTASTGEVAPFYYTPTISDRALKTLTGEQDIPERLWACYAPIFDREMF
ncbi:hypothetical protein VTI74DRAFT_3756 [Chaetomium olivicolor]